MTEDVKILARALAAAEGYAYDEPADIHYDKLAAKVIKELQKAWGAGYADKLFINQLKAALTS